MSEPAVPTAPRPFTTRVDPAWLDYNDHVTDSAYALIAALANEELCVDLGMSEDYQRETGRAFYSARLTVAYRREITAAAQVQVLRTITTLGTTSMLVTTDFQVDGRSAATTEHVYVLVDSATKAKVPLHPAERARIEPLLGRAF